MSKAAYLQIRAWLASTSVSASTLDGICFDSKRICDVMITVASGCMSPRSGGRPWFGSFNFSRLATGPRQSQARSCKDVSVDGRTKTVAALAVVRGASSSDEIDGMTKCLQCCPSTARHPSAIAGYWLSGIMALS